MKNTPFYNRRWLLPTFLLCIMALRSSGQSGDCPEAKEYRKKIEDLNAAYEKKKEEYGKGLFCSECKRSKSEIEEQDKKPFEVHLNDVKGHAYTATQAMYDKAHQDYLGKYNDFKDRFERAVASCKKEEQDARDRQAKEEADRQKRALDALNRKQQEEEDKRNREAEEDARKKEAAERQRQLREQEILRQMEEERRRLAEEHQKLVEDLQRQLDAFRSSRELENQRILDDWNQVFGKYKNGTIGSDSPGFSAQNVDDEAAGRNANLLGNTNLDSDDFDPNDSDPSWQNPSKPWNKVDQKDADDLIEKSKTKEPEKSPEERCREHNDSFDVPAELSIDNWGNPMNSQQFTTFIRQNGRVLFEDRGLKLTYLIQRAVTAGGLNQKICSVEESSAGATGRNIANNNRPLYWYHLYYLLENNSDYTISLNHFPTVQVSMVGIETNNMCDRFWCGGSDFFGSPGVMKLSASPYLMWPHSQTYDFGGAWYPELPRRDAWFLSPCFFDQTVVVIGKPVLKNLTATTALIASAVLEDHGAKVLSRGVCWGKTPDPKIEDTAQYDGTGTGPFTSRLLDLEPETLYYIRPFASNSTGTTYGAQITIQTPKS